MGGEQVFGSLQRLLQYFHQEIVMIFSKVFPDVEFGDHLNGHGLGVVASIANGSVAEKRIELPAVPKSEERLQKLILYKWQGAACRDVKWDAQVLQEFSHF